MLVVLGEHRRVAVAQAQAGVLFPGVAEPDGFGEPGVAEGGGEQGHAAAVFDGLELADIAGQDDLGAAGLRVGDQVGQVRAGQHRGLIDEQEGAGGDRDRAAGAAPAGQVAQELGAVVRPGDSGGQGVAGRLGRGDADHRAGRGAAQIRAASASTRVFPEPAGALITDTSRPSVSDGQRGGGLVLAQPAARARVPRRARVVRVVRAAGQRGLEPVRVRAERVRGLRARHVRRAIGAGVRGHARFHGQVRAGGVPGAAVPLVDAAPVRAQHAGRHLGRLGCLQAGDRLELRGQGPVGQVLQQRGGRGRVHPGPGQDPAQVLDHVRAGPGALVLLGQRDRLLRGAGQLQLGGHRAVRAARARARALAQAVPDRRRD